MTEYLIRLSNIQSSFVSSLNIRSDWDWDKPEAYLRNKEYRDESSNIILSDDLRLTERNGLQMISIKNYNKHERI